MFLIHAGNDRSRGADGLVPEKDRLSGLYIRQPVMVDDPDDFRLVQTGDGLPQLIMIHQDDLFSAGVQQMIA